MIRKCDCLQVFLLRVHVMRLFSHTPFSSLGCFLLSWPLIFCRCCFGGGLGWDKLSPSHKLYTSLNAKFLYITHAQYIIPVTEPSFTPVASIAFTPQTVRTLCIAPTTWKVGYDCNIHTHHHAWLLRT